MPGTKRTKEVVETLLKGWEDKLCKHLEDEYEVHNAVRNICEIIENLKDELKQLEK